MTFQEEALLWQSRQLPVPGRAQAEAWCRQLATSHYENFPVVTWALPAELRTPFYAVYAFCRWSDDLGDEIFVTTRPGDPPEPQRQDQALSLTLLDWWRYELRACYQGEVRHPVFVALHPVLTEFNLPIELFEDLISAFEQDQRVREYETFADLRDYCRRSADPVGRIVLHLFRVARPETFGWSDSICTGLQLANFWQDVARDYAAGRIYLPREDRERFGYSDDDLRQRVTSPEFQQLLAFQVERARTHLEAGQPLVEAVPGRLQIDVDLFLQGGLAILRAIDRIEYRVWDARPKLSKLRLAGLGLSALWRAVWRRVRPGN